MGDPKTQRTDNKIDLVADRSSAKKRRVMKTSELIAREIILDIARRGLTEGDPLPAEAKMLSYYRVGRASLREALRLLEVQQLVRIRPGINGGPIVGAATPAGLGQMMTLFLGLDGATYRDLTDVMLMLHPLVASAAASRKLTKLDRKALLDWASHSEPDTEWDSIRTESLGDFHKFVTKLARNRVWSLVIGAIDSIFSDHVIATTDSSGFHRKALHDHRAIAQAILDGDATRAAVEMRAHTERTIKFYRGLNAGIFSRLIEWK
ncbi:MAG: FCD domain-containing protein [Betaproteobacteria bacterium]